MLFAVITLIVLSAFNTFLIFGTLATTGRTRLDVNEAVSALCHASNSIAGRLHTLEGVVTNGVDCLVRYDAVMSADLTEE